MIASSIVSGYPGKYSYEIPHQYFSGWENLSGKIFEGNQFFKWLFPFSHMLLLFEDSFVFGEATSSQFFRLTTLTQQLLFRSSYFFKAAAFFRSSFFRTFSILQQLFFQNNYLFRAKLLPSNQFLRIKSSLGQLLFETATCLTEELFRIKISIEELLFQSR